MNDKYLHKKIKIFMRIFPELEKKEKLLKLKIDHESLKYISMKEYAHKITNIIKHHSNELNLDTNNMILTDCTAGVGGNTLSFASIFYKINAIEMNVRRAHYLKNNIDIYNYKNVNIYNSDCLNIIYKIKQDVVFIDPPWGGCDYLSKGLLQLKMSNIYIEDICLTLFDSKKCKYVPKLIGIKLPVNFDIVNFYNRLNKFHIYYYNLKKMIILIIQPKS